LLIVSPMRRRNTITNDLRDELSKALRAERFSDALALYELIEKRKPDEPRWPHRRADLLNRMGRQGAAVAAYEQAIELYAAKGFIERAIATAKVMLNIDPTKMAVLHRLEDEAANGLHLPILVTTHANVHHRH
jgi:tetratricopeptide (TPR) repeat protein